MSSSVIKNKNKIEESAREQTTKSTSKGAVMTVSRHKLEKQKADESLAVMCAYVNLDIKLKTA